MIASSTPWRWVAALLILVLPALAWSCAGSTPVPLNTPSATTGMVTATVRLATASPSAAPPTGAPSPTPLATPQPTTPASTLAPAPSGVAWRAGGAGLFSTLGGLDTDGDRVVVASAYQGILVFDLAGNDLGVLAPAELGYVVDVKIGPQGTRYMADNAFHQVTMFSREGDLLGAFGGLGTDDGEFGADGPLALAVSAAGEVFVLDPNEDAQGNAITRVQVFDEGGVFLRSFTVDPDFVLRAIAIGPDGTLFAVSPDGYVAEFTPEDGRLIQRLGLDALDGVLPQAVALDGAGNLFVTAQIPAAVALLDPPGQLIGWLGEETVRTAEGWPEGEFLFPFGIAVTDDGSTVFVGDTYLDFAYITALRRP